MEWRDSEKAQLSAFSSHDNFMDVSLSLLITMNIKYKGKKDKIPMSSCEI